MCKKICCIVDVLDFANFLPDENDFIITTDSGYEHFKIACIKSNLLIGDFDSILI